MHKIRFLALLAIFAVLLATVGCSPGTAKVSGKVTYNGKPVTGGTLTISPLNTKAAPVVVQLKENGEFECDAPVGEAKIMVDNRSMKQADKGAIGASGDYSYRGKETPGGPPGGAGRPRAPGMPGGVGPGPGSQPGGQGGGPAQMPKNDPNMKKAMEEKGAPSSFGGSQAGTYMDIPAKYHDGSADLTVTIKSGEPLIIDLKD